MSDDPFKPLNGSEKPKLSVVANDTDWAVVAPVPVGAPAPPLKHPTLGAPSGTWTYPDARSAVLGYTLRFRRDGGGKEFRPLTLWRSAKGVLTWRWVMWPGPRFLYGLDRLAARPVAPVVVCEGEKSADAAGRLLRGYVCVTSPGGAKAANKADWSPLRGRRVIIWPDADKPGQDYAVDVAKACTAIGAASVAIAPIPEGKSDGWDAADAEVEG